MIDRGTKNEQTRVIRDSKGCFVKGTVTNGNASGKNAGRPSVVTPTVLEQLIAAFKVGATDEEACNYAEISESALYRYERLNQEFRKQKKAYKREPVLKAKTTIVKALAHDVKVAMWYLERKARDEFDVKHIQEDTQVPLGAPRNEKEVELMKILLNNHYEYVRKREKEGQDTV